MRVLVPPQASATAARAGAGAGRPLAARGGPGLPGAIARAGGTGLPGGAAAPGERAGGVGGMPMGGAGARGQDKDHRNNVFIPDDEPFRVEFDDLTDPVLGTHADGDPGRYR